MNPQLKHLLKLDPKTQRIYDGLESPQKTWALAKAAFECAHESNFAEQKAASRAATLDDPEPVDWSNDEWRPWYERNKERIAQATKAIQARYPHELERLWKLAEANMVDFAEERITEKFGAERFAAVKPAFDAYREGDLYLEKLEQFLTICFNCP